MFTGKHFVELEAKLIVAMLVSRYEVHLDSSNPGTPPDSLDPRSFAGVRLKVVNRSGVRESRMYTSLQQLHNGNNEKFMFF